MSLGAGDFSTLWRLCMESPRQPKLASSLPNKRLSYWWLTGCGRNDKRVGDAGAIGAWGFFSWLIYGSSVFILDS